jgi:transcriptional regulator with XRE-family HTH domain
MPFKIDFAIATSSQIESALCERLTNIRLMKNLPQESIAREAGISIRTLNRLEKGLGVTLDTFIRVMMALNVQNHLSAMLPDADIRPIERVRLHGHQRQRARPKKQKFPKKPWVWKQQNDE